MVRVRQQRLGQALRRYGPHGLRHAGATYLLAEGFTLKQIGDHLGHTMVRATADEAAHDDRVICVGGRRRPESATDSDEQGVIRIRPGRKRSHTIYSVPESVALRIHTRLLNSR
jgi:hypothetical protein